MRIAITGGKGGIGKSSVATALSVELAKTKKVLLLDADVDCPNDHIILSIKRKKEQGVFQSIPKWDLNKCIKCGRCSNVCKQNAIIMVKEKFPVFFPEMCIGCNACSIICPTGAISKDKKQIGTIYSGKAHGIDLITGEMGIGYEESSPIVNAEKKFILEQKKTYDYIIVDTGAGTHCNVISALLDCDLALAVTEPTPLGAYDLKLILELSKLLKLSVKIIINKANLGDKKLIKNLIKNYDTEIIAEIPYKKEIFDQFSKGEPIKNKVITEIANNLIKKRNLL